MGKKKASRVVSYALAPFTGGQSVAYNERRLAKEKASAAAAEEAASASEKAAAQQAQIDALKAAEEQQDTVRKKLAALGRVQAGTAFNDASGTAQTKVFS